MRLYLEGSKMKLESSYDKMSNVPKGYEDAYTEKDGKAVLTGGGFEFKNEADVLAMETAKGHVKTELAEAREKLKAFDGIDASKQKEMLDELDTLRVKVKGGEGSEDQKAILEAMRARDREADTAKISELTGQLDEANGFKTKTQKDGLLKTALSKTVSGKAMSDALYIMNDATDFIDGKLLSNGRAGFDKGLEIEALTSKAMESREHWVKPNTPANQGGGSGGDTGTKTSQLAEMQSKAKAGTLTPRESNQMITIAREVSAEAQATNN